MAFSTFSWLLFAGLFLLISLIQSAVIVKDMPSQIHCTQGNADGTAITFSWVTVQVPFSKVLIRTEHGASEEHATEIPAGRYNFTSPSKELYVSQLIHHLTISGLQHATLYFYRCGSDQGGFSEEFSLKTPPRPSADAQVTFAIVGDIGQTEYSKMNMQDILADRSMTSLVIVGDLSYADSAEEPSPERPCGQGRWDSWFEMMQPLLANTLLMTLPGNHEVETPYHLDKFMDEQPPFLAYRNRLNMMGSSRLFYSYNYGSVHIIMLNSYMEFRKGSPQYKFLHADLEGVDRSITPWLIVNFHAPWYNSNSHHRDEVESFGMRKAMEDLLHKHEVDLVFSGHVHNYERMYPVYRNRTSPGAVTHIVVGDGGNREGPALGWVHRPEWSAFRLDQELTPLRIFGHGRVQVANRTHLHFRWRCLSQAPLRISDSIWLVKNTALGNGLQRGVTAIAD